MCALNAVDATGMDITSKPPPIVTPDLEHIASGISLVDYAQERAFLPDLTELFPNALYYTGDNVICPTTRKNNERGCIVCCRNTKEL